MSKIGFFCFLGRGHLNPAAALGRRLLDRGHDVTVFHLTIAQPAVLYAGLRFAPLDARTAAPARTPEWIDGTSRLDSVRTIRAHAEQVISEGPEAVAASGVDALVVDQSDLAAGSVADLLKLPFATLSCAPPAYLEAGVPAPYFYWSHSPGIAGGIRNRLGNAVIGHLLSPTLAMLNRKRQQWGLPSLRHLNDVFSKLAIVTQLPAILDFPRRTPVPHLFHTGPFRDERLNRRIAFPWNRLTEKALIYASLGTIRNNIPWAFRVMAQACAGLNVQLVLSLGGGRLLPRDLGDLPGDPVIVHFAPQSELIARAVLTINCGGLNTTLDSLVYGVPIIAIPVAEDQPGVAARIVRAGAGLSIPLQHLTVERLRGAIEKVMQDPAYRVVARKLRERLHQGDALGEAAGVIEKALSLTPRCSMEI